MIESPKQIDYRPAEPRDLEAIHRLWTEGTGWGSPAGAIRDWYAANPNPGSMAVVAVDESDQVVGQFAFMAAEVLVDGRAHRALRPIAPIVSRRLRFAQSEPGSVHPMFGMYRYAVRRARAEGVSLFYLLPDPLWAKTRFLQRIAPELRLLPLWSLQLPLQNPSALDAEGEAEPLADWDERVDALWRKTSRLHQCLAVRDAATLRWRSLRPGHTVTAVRAGGELIGIAVSQNHTKQWLICDLLVADGGEALRATLAALCRYAGSQSTEEKPYEKVSILVTPFLEGALTRLGFERVDYNLPLLAHPITAEVAQAEVAPKRWYVSAND